MVQLEEKHAFRWTAVGPSRCQNGWAGHSAIYKDRAACQS